MDMKLNRLKLIVIMAIALIQFNNVLAQEDVLDKKVSIAFEDITLKEALDKIAKKSGVSFAYNNSASLDQKISASFMNENLQAWYEEERTLTIIFGVASGIAIFLSCLGLFAISLLVIELRTKEISIRKVLGAPVKRIVTMISFHFLKLVLIALIISVPLAWFAMQNWIEGYEYSITISPLTFIGVGLLVALIALLTVSFHVIKAAFANPVESLRKE